ncbi:MAG: hypothetical protein HYU66_12985 [Armatimonadetes bacterium]|nr:hypothetical protein [Armatimonadota bacterium]
MLDPGALMAALDDPLGAAAVAEDGEVDLSRARALLAPLVGPTFVGDPHLPGKPLVGIDGTVAGSPMRPLRIEPGDMRCAAGAFPACLDIAGTDAAGQPVTRLLFAVTEDRATSVWWADQGAGAGCWRAIGGGAVAVAPEVFDAALAEVAETQIGAVAGAALLDVPDEFRVPARLSLLRGLNSFIGAHPKYGWGGYEGSEHDSFPPSLLALAHALCDVGLLATAKDRVWYWLEAFVRDDGSLDYYGPSLSEHGMLLDLVARLARTARDRDWTVEVVEPCCRVADRLVRLRAEAAGLLPGVPEADFSADQQAPHTVYYGNNLWCIRGLHELAAWLGEAGTHYGQAADAWWAEAQVLLAADSVYLPDRRRFLPPRLGLHEFPGRLTADRDSSYANYRFYPEMVSSRRLTPEQAGVIFAFRETAGGELCGTTRFADWLDDWPAMEMGLAHLDHDRVAAAQRLLVGHLAYHHAAGHETAYEQVSIRPGEHGWREPKAGYCVPVQLVAPRLLRALLVHEAEGALWLNRAGFRRWLAEGYGVQGVTTRWGRVSFRIESDGDGVRAEVDLSGVDEHVPVRLRLRRPDGAALSGIEVDGTQHEVRGESLALPRAGERVSVRAW